MKGGGWGGGGGGGKREVNNHDERLFPIGSSFCCYISLGDASIFTFFGLPNPPSFSLQTLLLEAQTLKRGNHGHTLLVVNVVLIAV